MRNASSTCNVLLLSRYRWSGASSRHRTLKYLPFLEREGFRFTVEPLVGDRYIDNLYSGQSTDWLDLFRAYVHRAHALLSSKRFDLVWVERELLPYLPALAEWGLDRLGIPYVIDYDDAIFHNYDRHRLWIVRQTLGHKIDAAMRHARMVIAGNGYLADRAHTAGARRVEIVPTAVDLDGVDPSVTPHNDVFTIGWIGTPPNARYLTPLAPALAEVSSGGRARLIAVGARKLDLDNVPTELRPWSFETEIAQIQSFDIGIMPIPDNPFERGKCGFKLLQYFSCARAAIASPVGVNATIVEHGVNGFLASSTKEWTAALTALRDDPALRARMGTAGRAKVERDYSTAKIAPLLAALLRQAAG